MDGSPLQAILALAVKAATETAKAEAQQALQQLDAAVQGKVDQVMGPINAIQSTVGNIQAGMSAVGNGNLSGAVTAMSAVSGLPTPAAFGNQIGGTSPGSAQTAQSSSSGKLRPEPAQTGALALPAAASAGGFGIERFWARCACRRGPSTPGAIGLGKAVGVGGGAGGGASDANVGGPTAL